MHNPIPLELVSELVKYKAKENLEGGKKKKINIQRLMEFARRCIMKQFLKKKIRVESGVFEYVLSGEGSPSVVLINGGGGPIEGWYKVFYEISKENSVIAYNRFGVGKSDKPSSQQDGSTIIKSLRELLNATKLRPPYVLVGHSLGGLYANLFARQYPDEVAGVVLLDSSHPKDLVINQLQGKFIQKLNKMFGILDSFSKHRKLDEVHFVKETVSQIEQSNSFPDIPLIVVSGSKKPPKWIMPDKVYKIRSDNQQDLIHLSKKSKQIVASKSGHFPQFSEPEIVINAVLECIKLSLGNMKEAEIAGRIFK